MECSTPDSATCGLSAEQRSICTAKGFRWLIDLRSFLLSSSTRRLQKQKGTDMKYRDLSCGQTEQVVRTTLGAPTSPKLSAATSDERQALPHKRPRRSRTFVCVAQHLLIRRVMLKLQSVSGDFDLSPSLHFYRYYSRIWTRTDSTCRRMLHSAMMESRTLRCAENLSTSRCRRQRRLPENNQPVEQSSFFRYTTQLCVSFDQR